MSIHDLLTNDINQKELLNYYNASLLFERLPNKINGFVFNHDDINFIILDKNLSEYKRKKVFLHELAHIELNQLGQSNKDLFAFKINNYEDEADRYLKTIKENID